MNQLSDINIIERFERYNFVQKYHFFLYNILLFRKLNKVIDVKKNDKD